MSIINVSTAATLTANVTQGMMRRWTLEERAQLILSQPVAIISLILCFLAIVANCFSILATMLGPNGMVTHNKLIVSLGLSDILLSFSVVSHTINKVLIPYPHKDSTQQEVLTFYCMTIFAFALYTMATIISLLNLFAMAVDHYVAIMKPLHYAAYLSRARGNCFIVTIWMLAIFCGFSVFLSDIRNYGKRDLNYCHYLKKRDFQGEYLIIAVAFLCLLTILYTYLRIYIEVRRVHRQGPSARMDYVRNRKALFTTLVIIGTFAVCWLPTCLMQIILTIQAKLSPQSIIKHFGVLFRLQRYLNCLILVNTLCDPIVYAVRLRDVQLGYRRIFQKCLFFRSKRRGSLQMTMERRNTQIARLLTMDSITIPNDKESGNSLCETSADKNSDSPTKV
ncbi:melanocortin receptor 3-like [Haliotis rufescens]|uniref:melanocortin receptor 3-like n=1 Tax=Haliotis rufescens TaxID=6454 RepID=UPI001EB05928|nr:melanocortin receptor 3-like [Haliotis rufescens]